jgi:hypothetical protein
MRALKTVLLISLALLILPSVVMASTCQTLTANNIAADDGCTVTVSYATFVFSNFGFTLGTVTAPGGFSATDNTISFSGFFAFNAPGVLVTDTGDSLWDISSGQWGFTLDYSITTTLNYQISDFEASEIGAATGTGGSSISTTLRGLTSTATNTDPDPPFLGGFSQAGTSVTETVSNQAGSGTSDLFSVSSAFQVPEPASAAMIALWASVLVCIRRFRPSKFVQFP